MTAKASTPPAPPLPNEPPGPGAPTPDPPLPDPDVQPSSTPEGPQVIPSPSTPPGEPGPDPSGMGVSSERVPHDPRSVEGTGSRGTATEAPEGTWDSWEPGQANDLLDEETNPAKVPPHPFDRTRNPGHSHGS